MVKPGTFTAKPDAPRAKQRRMSHKHGPAERYAKTLPAQALRDERNAGRRSQGMCDMCDCMGFGYCVGFCEI